MGIRERVCENTRFVLGALMDLGGLVEGRLLRRYKRFLADVELANGEQLTVHCPNTGAMTGCAEPGSRVWLKDSSNPKRKYRYTWELVEPATGVLACIHSARANALAEEALVSGVIAELQGYRSCQREVPFGIDNSRADLFLGDGEAPDCYVEVKSVTLDLGDGLGVFPDAVSARGRKHLRELMAVRAEGRRAVLLFAVLHSGIERVAPADTIDPAYAATLREAMDAGVEVLAYGTEITPTTIRLATALPVLSHQPD